DDHESIVVAAAVLLKDPVGAALRGIERREVSDESAADAVCGKNDSVAGLEGNGSRLKGRHLRAKDAGSEQEHFLDGTFCSVCPLHHALHISDAKPAHLTQAGKN